MMNYFGMGGGIQPALGITNYGAQAAMTNPALGGGLLGGAAGGAMGALAGAIGSKRRKAKVNYVVDDSMPALSAAPAQQIGLGNLGKGGAIGNKQAYDLASSMGDAIPEALRRRRQNIQTNPNVQLENK